MRRFDKQPFGAPSAVDLGLRVKWASCNLGACTPAGRGDFFAWGEVEPKENFTFENHLYSDIEKDKYIQIGKNISATKFDAAKHILGVGWRMPTEDEFYELMNACKWELITLHDVWGYNIVGPNGNSIFLPITGVMYEDKIEDDTAADYWSATLCDEDDGMYCAFCLSLNTDGEYYGSYGNPLDGQSIRPVADL